VQRLLDELGESAPAHERARAEMLVADARAAVEEQAPRTRVEELTRELQGVLGGLQAASSGRGPGSPGGASPGASPGAGPGPADGGGGGVDDDDVIDAQFDRS
jgi:molecular chaperone DnaK